LIRTIRGQRSVIAKVCVICLAFPAGVVAQQPRDQMAGTVGEWYAMIEQSFVALADAMPAEQDDFKPTDGEFANVRRFGEQVRHVACANVAFFNGIEHKEPPDLCETGGPSPATTKAELMAYLRDSFVYGKRVLGVMTQQNALDPASGRYGGSNTRLGLTTRAVWHASDHYGQLVGYLRMNGIVLPASRS
jgi:DinB superfamily